MNTRKVSLPSVEPCVSRSRTSSEMRSPSASAAPPRWARRAVGAVSRLIFWLQQVAAAFRTPNLEGGNVLAFPLDPHFGPHWTDGNMARRLVARLLQPTLVRWASSGPSRRPDKPSAHQELSFASPAAVQTWQLQRSFPTSVASQTGLRQENPAYQVS